MRSEVVVSPDSTATNDAAVVTFDVRPVPKPERHPRIHELLDGLAPGEALRLVADHEPVHLRNELERLRPNEIIWDSRGPDGDAFTVFITQRVRLVDARPLIEAGEEPFETIMAAVAELGDDEDLVVAAPFEPTPLEGVLGSQGFAFEVNEVQPGHWRVLFHREG